MRNTMNTRRSLAMERLGIRDDRADRPECQPEKHRWELSSTGSAILRNPVDECAKCPAARVRWGAHNTPEARARMEARPRVTEEELKARKATRDTAIRDAIRAQLDAGDEVTWIGQRTNYITMEWQAEKAREKRLAEGLEDDEDDEEGEIDADEAGTPAEHDAPHGESAPDAGIAG